MGKSLFESCLGPACLGTHINKTAFKIVKGVKDVKGVKGVKGVKVPYTCLIDDQQEYLCGNN